MSEERSTWLDACDRFARQEGVAPAIAMLLRAFAGPEPRGGPPPPAELPWTSSFGDLERTLLTRDDLGRVAAEILLEVDPAQAEMFERRVRAVDQFLETLGDAEARLLRVGLRQRLRGILSGRPPRATRVRALADFYYSHASRHHHRRRSQHAETLHDVIARSRVASITNGLEHVCLEGVTEDGLMRVNVLFVDPQHVRVRVVDARSAVDRKIPFERHVTDEGAVAGTSGGFFLYSESDIAFPSRRYDPVGLLVDDGTVVSPPVFARGAVAVTEASEVVVEPIGLEGLELRLGDGPPWTLKQTWNRAHGSIGPDRPTVAVVGGVVVASGRALPIPLNGFVTPLPSGIAAAAGDRVQWGAVRTAGGARVRAAMGGGPMLVRDGRVQLELRAEHFWGTAPPVTFSQDETGDQNLLPRMAAGVDAGGRLVLAAVDGRNLDRALGMTLHGLGELMLALGCRAGTNLDGGSSKRMVVGGVPLDLASTEIVATADRDERIRPVHTAILLEPRR